MRFLAQLTYHLILVCSLFYSVTLSAQNNQKQQPYNRFQYHQFKWRVVHVPSAHIYFPIGHDSLCSKLMKELPETIALLKYRMGHALVKPPNIIIYPSVDQAYESNIGLYESKQFTLPSFVKKGNRVVLHCTGDFEQVKTQLREAIARSIWERQLNDEFAKQLGKREAIPKWFKEGAIRYFANQWTIQNEDQLQRSFDKEQFANWEQVIACQPRLAGQAFCYFLAEQYYPLAVTQLYGQLQKKKDLRKTIRFITKSNLNELYVECYLFYQQRFKANNSKSKSTASKTVTIPHENGIVSTIKLSPGQKYVAYVVYKNKKRFVFVHDTKTKTTKKISSYALPPWIEEYSRDLYPLIEWENNKSLVVTQPTKGKLIASHYTPTGVQLRSNKLYGLDGINTIQSQGRNNYLLSGYRRGQTDLVTYNANRNRYAPITNDKEEETSLALGSTNPYYFITQRADSSNGDTAIVDYQGLYQITDTITKLIADSLSYIKWDKPIITANQQILLTHTRYGQERFTLIQNLNNPEVTTQTLSNYQPYQYLEKTNEILFTTITEDSVTIKTYPFDVWVKNNTNKNSTSPWLRDYQKRIKERAKEDSLLQAVRDNNPSFLDKVLLPANAKEKAQSRKDSLRQLETFNQKKVKPYVLQLHSAYFSAKVNNDYYINRYQPYLNYQGKFKFPEVSGMAEGGFTDVLENHHINIAFRIPAGNEGSDFFVKYKNTAKKLDWGLTYFRKVEQLQADPQRNWKDENGNPYPNAAKVKTHYYELSLHYPLSYYLSLGLEQAFRMDRTIFQATDKYSLKFEDIKSNWSITSLSLKWNKLRPTVPLLHKGYQAKLLVDAFKSFSQKEAALMGSTIHLEYHQPLYKYITLVVQGKAGYSAGDNYVLYNMGGTDNNLTVRQDSNIIFSQTAPYAFQTLVTPFRGQLQNTLYGNQYVLFNTDIYFPLFQTLIPVETPLSFVNNLQLGLFTDIGVAQETWKQPQITNNWQQSYGLSARTTLANYPLRVDVAWPNSLSNKPVWYLSLNVK